MNIKNYCVDIMKNKFAGFTDRAILRTIAGGHPVPWPEELCEGHFVCQKDYRMNTFPRTSEGNVWYDIPDKKYLFWLNDYLPENIPDLTLAQEKIEEIQL